MHLPTAFTFLSALILLPFLVYASCPLPVEPHLPIPPLSAADFSSLLANLTAETDMRLGRLIDLSPTFANISVSVVVTGQDEMPWFTYNFGPEGSNVTSDSIYRIASISKVFAVYEALVNHLDLDDTVGKWIPEFQRDEVAGITLRSLAGQTSGLTRDYYINTLSQRELVYPPSSFPSYSNMAYDVLGQIVELKTGKNYSDLIAHDVAHRLNMPRTSLLKPDDSLGVIPTALANRSWYEDFGWAGPAGAMYSSASDLAQFARLILNDLDSFNETSLGLPGHVLREWFKPHSYTASNVGFVGLPWEDVRPSIPGLNGGFPFTVHIKSGSLIVYESELAIVPEYGFGLSVLATGGPSGTVRVFEDELVLAFARAVEAKRVQHANDTYAGTYSAAVGNSTVVFELKVADDGLGLELVRWGYGSLDILGILLNPSAPMEPAGIVGAPIHQFHQFVRRQSTNTTTPVYRLFPTQAFIPDTWRMSLWSPASPASPVTESIFAGDCGEWFVTDALYYGGQPADKIRFIRDEAGSVAEVEIPWLRLKLAKQAL
ncbi:hypothetical protein H2201_002706 [Coniosporium apollinis]|uniref:Beta-lactamase-related domain-containing protein n=1 Tax=Coniosporium apollinis TaxID=61459 RepID=A0ABQ9NXS0_9PEZI|nr:hypothetical protein H2201_002706 [Coniosporium apollinis]